MQRLDLMLKVEAVVFLVYGAAFFVLPSLLLETIFNFNQSPTFLFVRALGGTLIVLAVMGYLISGRLSTRLDLVWCLAVIPAFMLVALIWDRLGTSAVASDSFFWASAVLMALLAAGVGYLRWSVKNN